jgi:hypothetical protein
MRFNRQCFSASLTIVYTYTVKKPCRNVPNSDVDNGGAEPKNVGVGIFRPPRRLVRATVVHIGYSRSFFYSVLICKFYSWSAGLSPVFSIAQYVT